MLAPFFVFKASHTPYKLTLENMRLTCRRGDSVTQNLKLIPTNYLQSRNSIMGNLKTYPYEKSIEPLLSPLEFCKFTSLHHIKKRNANQT